MSFKFGGFALRFIDVAIFEVDVMSRFKRKAMDFLHSSLRFLLHSVESYLQYGAR